jgi:hypothetical protein
VALGRQVDDPADVGDEAHVQHAVALIENEHLDLREVDRLLLDVVESPGSRRRPGAWSSGELWVERHAAVDGSGSNRAKFSLIGRSPRPGPSSRG